MGPFLWAWHPISTAALVQCPPIAGNARCSIAHSFKVVLQFPHFFQLKRLMESSAVIFSHNHIMVYNFFDYDY